MSTTSITHAVLLTPQGRGAVATVLVDGTNAADLVSVRFQAASEKSLADYRLGEVVFGHWQFHGMREELVVCCVDPCRVEVHCHGGPTAARRIIDSLAELGAVELSWQDWLRQPHQGQDRLAAAALESLALARTERTAAILLEQYRGALSRAIADIVKSLQAGNSDTGTQRLEELLQWANVGLHLTSPWKVVLAGRPNAGKSSLINALVGYQRALVFEEPGTTRDVVTANTALDGWIVEFADTAGLRTSRDRVEAAGIQRARQELAQADLVVWVHDASRQWSPTETELCRSNSPALIVHNKSDLTDQSEPQAEVLLTSALLGTGIAELAGAIVRRLIPEEPPAGAAVPFTALQVESLRQACDAVSNGTVTDAVRILGSLS